MVMQFRAPQDTYLVADGGTLSAEIRQDLVVKWVNAIEPRKTPLLDKIMSSDEFSQEVHQWGQSYHIDLDTLLNGATIVGATSFTVDDGDLFQIGMIIQVADPMVGTTDVPNMTNAELLRVTNIVGNVLTTTAAVNAHADNAIVSIVGTTEALNSEHTEAPRQRGLRFFNYPQRFQAKLTADKRAQNMPTWEIPDQNPLLVDLANEVVKQKMLLERSVYYGTRQAGATTGPVPSRFGGLPTFLTTNSINLLGAKLTARTLEDITSELWYETDDNAGGLLVMSMNTARIWDTVLDPQRRGTLTDVDLTRGIRTYKLRTGNYSIMETRNAPEGQIFLINPEYIKVRPFKGLNWHMSEKMGSDNAVDHDIKAISGDFTLEVHNEHAMARLWNFDPVLANYP